MAAEASSAAAANSINDPPDMFSCGECGETRPHEWSILTHFSTFHANDAYERECRHSVLTEQGNDDEDIDGPQPMVDSSVVQTWYQATSGVIAQYSPNGWHTCRPCAKKYKSHIKWSQHNLSESHRDRLITLGIRGMRIVSSDKEVDDQSQSNSDVQAQSNGSSPAPASVIADQPSDQGAGQYGSSPAQASTSGPLPPQQTGIAELQGRSTQEMKQWWTERAELSKLGCEWARHDLEEERLGYEIEKMQRKRERGRKRAKLQ